MNKEIILTFSLTLNLFLLSLVLVLWFIRCKICGKDKEIRQVFNKLCEKCEKGNGKKKKEAEI